ncbi:MAG: DUF1501 domain-containing protein, partial [Planctomycetota bacterium]
MRNPELMRRSFLKAGTYSVGMAALSSLLAREASAVGRSPATGLPPHFPDTAKTVIHLCMAGGPSHLESLDPKPKLRELDGKPFPASFTAGQ